MVALAAFLLLANPARSQDRSHAITAKREDAFFQRAGLADPALTNLAVFILDRDHLRGAAHYSKLPNALMIASTPHHVGLSCFKLFHLSVLLSGVNPFDYAIIIYYLSNNVNSFLIIY